MKIKLSLVLILFSLSYAFADYGGINFENSADGLSYYALWGEDSGQNDSWHDCNGTKWKYMREVQVIHPNDAKYNYYSYQVNIEINNSSASCNQFRVVLYNDSDYFEVPSFVEGINSSYVRVWWRINYSIDPVLKWQNNYRIYYGNESESYRDYKLESVFDKDNSEENPILELNFDRNNTVAMEFDGDDEINCGNDSSINDFSEITLTSWIYLNSWGGSNYGRIFVKGDSKYFHVDGSAGLRFSHRFSNGLVSWIKKNNILSFSHWYHVSVTYNNTNYSNNPNIYIDGVLQEINKVRSSTGVAKSDNSGHFLIGNDSYEGNCYFDGKIDDLRYYNRILSQKEIRDIILNDNPTINGLKLYLNFEDNNVTHCFDHSGNRNNGTISEATESGTFVYDSSHDGNNWQAMEFDGVDDEVIVSNLGFSGDTSITISAWINPSSAHRGVIFGFGQTNQDEAFFIRTEADGTYRFGFWWNDLVEYSNYGTDYDIHGWIHLVCLYDSANSKRYIYEDNILLASDSTSDPNFQNQDYSIGNFNSDYFNGLIDNIQIYDRALTSSEITKLYNAENLEENRILFYDFEEESGEVIDKTLNYNGTLSGAYRVPINRYHGTLNGSNWSNSTPPEHPVTRGLFENDGYFEFDGVGDYISLGDQDWSAQNVGSISFWIKHASNNDWDTIYHYWNDNDNQILILLGPSYGGLRFYVELSNSVVVDVRADLKPSNNQWYHVVCSQDGQNSKMYVNGKLQIDSDSGEWYDDVGAASEVVIGNKHSYDFAIDGKIDEVKIYDRALSPDEVLRRYYSSKYSLNPPILVKSDQIEYNSDRDHSVYVDSGTDYLDNEHLRSDFDYSNDPVKDGLVGHWTFDGHVSDVFGENHGKINGNPQYDKDGQLGYSMDFDGEGDYIGGYINAETIENEFSVSFWEKNLFCNSSSDCYHAICIYNGDSIKFGLSFSDGSGVYDHRLICYSDAWSTDYILTDVDSFDGTSSNWRYITVTYQNSEVKVYFDGNLVANNTTSGGSFGGSNDDSFLFGKRKTADIFLTGKIDDIRIYDKALSSEEVNLLYNYRTEDITSTFSFRDNDISIQRINGSVSNYNNLDLIADRYNNTIENSLIHHWTLDSNFDDVVGGNNLTNVGGVTLGDEYGIYSQGAHFENSSNQYLSLDSEVDLVGKTFSLWIKREDIANMNGLWSIYSNGAYNEHMRFTRGSNIIILENILGLIQIWKLVK